MCKKTYLATLVIVVMCAVGGGLLGNDLKNHNGEGSKEALDWASHHTEMLLMIGISLLAVAVLGSIAALGFKCFSIYKKLLTDDDLLILSNDEESSNSLMQTP